jgi:tRNA threonylcarbamoyladenosine biosynthesis protein TsaE
MICHIIQLAVPTEYEPFQQASFGFSKIGVADAYGLKAKFMRPCTYLCGKYGVIILLRVLILHNHDDSRITLSLADENATITLARRLAASLKPGMVIYLQGDLGAGKTTLVRGVLNALGYTGRVKSPTYTLVEPYHIAGLDLRHFDLYRLHEKEEWEAAGFRDEFDGYKIFFIEWPEHALGLIPQADVKIDFEILQQGRKVEIQAGSPTGRECLIRL